MEKIPPKTIVIVGPTASGKSDLAIALARRYNGEIISADSRQVYRGMDIGTGKVTRDKTETYHITDDRHLCDTKGTSGKQGRQRKNTYLSEGIVHHLLDVASPKRTYNITHFVRDAKKAALDIRKRGKVPIICGGTGFWVQAFIEGQSFPAVKPDTKLRAALGKKSAPELFKTLSEKDPERANTIDRHNKIRLIRALEIIAALGKVPSLQKNQESLSVRQAGRIKNQKFLIVALSPPKEILRKRIAKRLEKRLAEGMIEEGERLHKEGVSWKRLESFGLEYRHMALLLRRKITREEMQETLEHEIWHYAKRQLTWLRRWEKIGARIHWIADPKKALEIIEKND